MFVYFHIPFKFHLNWAVWNFTWKNKNVLLEILIKKYAFNKINNIYSFKRSH